MDLVKRSSELNAVSKPSLMPQEIMLGKEMELTRQNSKVEVETGLAAEFYRVFAEEKPEAIQWAFRKWRDQSAFFPAISEIKSLLAEWWLLYEYVPESKKRKMELAERENRGL